MATGDTLVTHGFRAQLGAKQVESLQEVSGLTLELDTIEVKQVNRDGQLIIRKIPGARKAGEVTITRGLDRSKELTNWLKETFERGAVNTARQNLSIVLLNSELRTERTFTLKNAWVSKWEGPTLKAGEAAAATEKITLVYEDIEATG